MSDPEFRSSTGQECPDYWDQRNAGLFVQNLIKIHELIAEHRPGGEFGLG
jgi:hypothetical protein